MRTRVCSFYTSNASRVQAFLELNELIPFSYIYFLPFHSFFVIQNSALRAPRVSFPSQGDLNKYLKICPKHSKRRANSAHIGQEFQSHSRSNLNCLLCWVWRQQKLGRTDPLLCDLVRTFLQHSNNIRCNCPLGFIS